MENMFDLTYITQHNTHDVIMKIHPKYSRILAVIFIQNWFSFSSGAQRCSAELLLSVIPRDKYCSMHLLE